jgi:hypothetical protein
VNRAATTESWATLEIVAEAHAVATTPDHVG